MIRGERNKGGGEKSNYCNLNVINQFLKHDDHNNLRLLVLNEFLPRCQKYSWNDKIVLILAEHNIDNWSKAPILV